jgi:hypothetical protein
MSDTRLFFDTFAVLGCVRGVDLSLVTDVSGQPIGPISNGRPFVVAYHMTVTRTGFGGVKMKLYKLQDSEHHQVDARFRNPIAYSVILD